MRISRILPEAGLGWDAGERDEMHALTVKRNGQRWNVVAGVWRTGSRTETWH